jgi:thioredoxin-like negative regulator of GroEL
MQKLDRIDDAIDLYRRARSFSPHAVSPRLALADLLEVRGERDEACELLLEVIAAAPDRKDILSARLDRLRAG